MAKRVVALAAAIGGVLFASTNVRRAAWEGEVVTRIAEEAEEILRKKLPQLIAGN